MCNFNVHFSKIFWGLGLQTPFLGRGYGDVVTCKCYGPPRRSGASRLLASLGTFGPSIVVPPLTKILATHLVVSILLMANVERVIMAMSEV